MLIVIDEAVQYCERVPIRPTILLRVMERLALVDYRQHRWVNKRPG